MSDADLTRAHRGEIADRNYDLDTLFDVLSDQRRRRLLYALVEAETTTVADLTETVSERVAAGRTELGLAFHHVHLPKLAAAGLIDYEPKAGTVRYDEDPFLEEVLAWTAQEDRS